MRKTLLMCVVLCAFFGCGNVVPPGTTVIVLTPEGEAQIHKNGAYVDWGRDKVYFVDTKLKSYNKNLKVLCSDDVNMDVAIKWVGAFKVTTNTIGIIKNKVPARRVSREDISGFQLSLDDFFKATMSDVLSSIARDCISKYKTDNIRAQRGVIQETIKQLFLKKMAKLAYPVETTDVLLTNLDYPKEITARRKSIKDAELQDLENAAIAKAEVAKARRDAELAVERGKAQLVYAKADAAANRARAKSLTPEILAVKQLETLVTLAKGQNNSVVVIPYEAIRPGGIQNMLINREEISNLKR